jgi:hypothetical protein
MASRNNWDRVRELDHIGDGWVNVAKKGHISPAREMFAPFEMIAMSSKSGKRKDSSTYYLGFNIPTPTCFRETPIEFTL